MAKVRIPIPPDTAAAVLFASDYTCCVCRDPGRPVQIHHVDENPSNNSEENLSVLCLLCHNDTQVKGGFGRKLNAKPVIQYRDDWVQRVIYRRDKADELAALRMAGSAAPSTEGEAKALMVPADEALVSFIRSLPSVLGKGYAIARPRWDSGVTAEMVQGSYDLIDIVVQMLVHLASWFPRNHFGGKSAPEYLGEFVSTRFNWHRSLAEPDGIGTGGTIVGPIATGAVLDDVERAVDEMVTALLWAREGFNLKAWRGEWENAK